METVAGLDIGSSYVVAAVAVPAPGPGTREARFAGEQKETAAPVSDPAARGMKIGYSATAGMRRGQVSDIAALSGCIREALSRAESAAGVRVETVCAGFSGQTVEFSRNKYGNLVGKRRINRQDIERINRLALISDLPPGRQIIQAMPVEYIADGTPVAGDPLGMHCSRLEVESLIFTADNALVDQLLEAVRRAGVSVKDIFPSCLAAGEVLLKKSQQQLGTAFIDIGGSCTCVLVYNHGFPVGMDVLPVGGDHITSDLAICLRTTLEGAEGVKRSVGLGLKSAEGLEKEDLPGAVTIPRLSGSGFNEAPVKSALDIIEARAGEILELIQSSVSRLAGGLDLPGGLILAGGGSRLKGLDLFASDYLGVKVQMEYPGLQGEESGDFVNAAGAAGLLKYMIKHNHMAEEVEQPPADLWSKVRGIFKI